MSFLYSCLTFVQPGILWPEIADLRPVIVVTLLGFAIGLPRRSDYPRRDVFTHPIFVCLLIFSFAQVVSVYYSGIASMLDEFSFWSAYPLFVVISILLISNPVALKRYVLGMIAGSMVVVLYGIYAVYAQLPSAIQGRAGAYGLYENHNDYSFIIIMVLPFIYMYWRSQSGMPGLIRRGLLALCMVACVVGIFLSLSRGGMLALVLQVVLIVLFGMQGRRRLFLLPILAVAGVAAIVYQWNTRAENQGANYTASQAESSRFELWRIARKMIEAKPLLGVGSRRYREFSQDYGEVSHDNRGKVSHNTYLEILTGSGLIGFTPFALMVYYMFRELRRRPRHPGPPWLDATRTAALISFCSILARALLDAKPHDWSFYVLFSIGLTCGALQRQIDLSPSDQSDAPAGEAGGDAAHARTNRDQQGVRDGRGQRVTRCEGVLK